MKSDRLVIKIGTSVLSTASGRIDDKRMRNITDQVAALTKKGHEVLLVSSGAIAAGVERLNMESRPKEIPALQAAAAVGQGLLFEKYVSLFMRNNLAVGQVLLTQYDTTHRQQYLNAKNALNELLKMGVVPIINENDTTAVDEIRFGDNDTLAALVAVLIDADLLIILSDIDRLYTSDPRKDTYAKAIRVVDEITPEIEAMAAGIGSRFGSGGMVTKIGAARIVTAAKIGMIIADGRQENVLQKILKQQTGTYFKPAKKKISSRKIWIGYGRTPSGIIYVDDGAMKALMEFGGSLLPAGITDVEGNFNAGDAVSVADQRRVVFARGLTNYSADELKEIRGKRSSEISRVEAGEVAEEVIHRDCLVLL